MINTIPLQAMRSPLHRYALPARAKALDNSCGVWANEVPLLGYITIRGNAQQPEFLAAVKLALMADIPTLPCSMLVSNGCSIYWLSPDEWLITCPREQMQSLQQSLKAALTGIHSQVVDNSGGYTTVILSGKNASDVLQHCTIYNLHHLKANHVVGTTFGKMSVYLYRHVEGRSEGEAKVADAISHLSYGLIFRRSFADYIWPLLERSASPYGFGILSLSAK